MIQQQNNYVHSLINRYKWLKL